MNPLPPDLTFACELDPEPLDELFQRSEVIPFLQDMHATVSLGILDLSDRRAEVVRKLNEAGVPVTAWLLLPRDQGYWFNLDNSPQATTRYEHFRTWTENHGLRWARIGLDIEPDIRSIQMLSHNTIAGAQRLISNLVNQRRLKEGARAYHALVEQIHADGYEVETYQMPFMIDERMARSSLLQRVAGLVDLPETDREVLMLYSTFTRPLGQGLLWSYAPQAQGIGVGITGKGMEAEMSLDVRPMSWAELETDLLLARRHCESLFIYSLEGCVQQGFLEPLRNFDWQKEVKIPILYAQRINNYRNLAGRVLWMLSRPAWMLFGLALTISAVTLVRRRKR